MHIDPLTGQQAAERPAAVIPVIPAVRVQMPESQRQYFGRRIVRGTHALAASSLFSDAALIDLLDHFPRQHLYALSTGLDPSRVEDNRLARHEGVSGTDLMQAVREGRLWLNLTRVDRADARYRQLIDALYAQLREQAPDFVPEASQGTLLISSPQALVYYHADGPASVLWHLRGRKRVWVYPALDPRYMKTALLEDIFAGVRHEYLPYEAAYDAAAEIYDLEPGQWLAWPQNAPHRVTNQEGVNVSLSTEHFTAQTRRRFRVYLANRFFRTRLGVDAPSLREDGAVATLKTLVQRSARKLGLDPVPLRQNIPVLQVVVGAPGGVGPLAGAARAESP